MKLLIALLALSCFGQTKANECAYFTGNLSYWAPCPVSLSQRNPIRFSSLVGTVNLSENGPRVAADLVSVATMAQLGIPVPPPTTDHIRVTVTNLDPATTKVTICLHYFEDGEEVKVERTVSRTEAGASYLHWVKDAAKITSHSATAVELGVIQ